MLHAGRDDLLACHEDLAQGHRTFALREGLALTQMALGARLVWGHLLLTHRLAYMAAGRYALVTMMRAPVARALSNYRMAVRAGVIPDDLDAWLDGPVGQSMAQAFLRYLSGRNVVPPGDQAGALATARANLRASTSSASSTRRRASGAPSPRGSARVPRCPATTSRRPRTSRSPPRRSAGSRRSPPPTSRSTTKPAAASRRRQKRQHRRVRGAQPLRPQAKDEPRRAIARSGPRRRACRPPARRPDPDQRPLDRRPRQTDRRDRRGPPRQHQKLHRVAPQHPRQRHRREPPDQRAQLHPGHSAQRPGGKRLPPGGAGRGGAGRTSSGGSRRCSLRGCWGASPVELLMRAGRPVTVAAVVCRGGVEGTLTLVGATGWGPAGAAAGAAAGYARRGSSCASGAAAERRGPDGAGALAPARSGGGSS